jgi:hypothetical protein
MSVLDGSGTVWGTIGEYVVREYLRKKKIKAKFPKEFSIDFDINANNLKLEIKSKRCKNTPFSNYEGSTPCYYDQKCDYYIFTRVRKDWKRIWIMGCISKKDFHESRKIQKGNSYRGSNRVFYKSDSHIIPYYKCQSINSFIKENK